MSQAEVVEQVLEPKVQEAIRQIVRQELGQNDPAARRLLGKPAAAEFLNVSVRSIDRLAGKDLPFTLIAGRRKFLVADLVAYQRRHASPASL